MARTIVTLLAVGLGVFAVYAALRVLFPQLPQANIGILGAMIGLIAGGIVRQRGARLS